MTKSATHSERRSSVSLAEGNVSETIDELLASYLKLLDLYTSHHEVLSKNLSTGFLSLAQANFSSNHMRYGQDCYDSRMQATFTVNILPTPESQWVVEAAPSPSKAGFPTSERDSDPKPGKTTDSQNRGISNSQEGTTGSGSSQSSVSVDTDINTKASEGPLPEASSGQDETSPLSAPDPIRQFGILVPQSLRAAQRSFAEGARECFPKLAETAQRMRILERKIEALRASGGGASLGKAGQFTTTSGMVNEEDSVNALTDGLKEVEVK